MEWKTLENFEWKGKWSKMASERLEKTRHILTDPIDSSSVFTFTEDTVKWLKNGRLEAEISSPEKIVNIEFLSISNELCIATEPGSVILHNLSTGDEEIVTYCEGGIEAMQFSPDTEIVVFVTRATNNVVVLNCSFDPIAESCLHDAAFGDQEFITVGWGRKETQFHGSEGKQAALRRVPAEEDATGEQQVDRRVLISWRDDCEYFAVSFVGASGRMFKVFNKEGALQFTSEKCVGLEACLAWRPSGNWIAVPQWLPNKYVVALFEKNGLRHLEVVLPFKRETEEVRKLSWSSDSEVLLVETSANRLYLFTTGNYHWYLKQTLSFKAPIGCSAWDSKPSEGKRLHLVTEEGGYLVYKWTLAVDHSPGDDWMDEACVAVIDGTKALLTPLRGTVIPPPMCGLEVKEENPINFVGFRPNLNQFFTVDSTGRIKFYQCVFSDTEVKRIERVETLREAQMELEETVPLQFHHFLWIEEDKIIFCNEQEIYLGKISEKLEILDVFKASNGSIGALIPAKNSLLIIHYLNGVISELSIASERFQEEKLRFKLSEFCDRILPSTSGEIVALKTRQNLYRNDTRVASDVTSAFLTEDFLIFTTIDELNFIDLKSPGGRILYSRKVERGSRLVLVVPKSSKTVLQMPRGNLEAIHPRILSLQTIGRFLERLEYRRAFEILRKERINLNIIVDHDPRRFVENIDAFIADLDNPQWLNLFLSDLQPIDVTKEMYLSNYEASNREPLEGYATEEKIPFICDRIIAALSRNQSGRFILSLVTAHVKKGDLEAALRHIWSLNDDEGAKLTPDEALTYLLYLVDVNDLYNVALGMYDFPLTIFVAKRSQKDPKEYLPFLTELNALEEHYRRFRIDVHLKRFDRAVENIARLGSERFDEALTLIEGQKLYTKAMEAYAEQPECYREVCRRFGDHLRIKGRLLDASLMYERGEDLEQAISAARNALDWRRAVALAKRKGATEEDLRRLVSALSVALQGKGQFGEAAEILRRFGGKLEQILDALLAGKLYEEALLEARLENEALIGSKIHPHFTAYISTLQITIDDDLALFDRHKTRLKVIREEKEKRKNAPDEDQALDDCDLYSDTSSLSSSKYTSSSSRGTGKTFRSSKNRRKHERKLLNLKEGNKFEDIALIDAIHGLAMRVYAVEQQKHIRSVCKVAVELRMDAEARRLQKSFGRLLYVIKDSLNEIWLPEMMTSGEFPTGPEVDFSAIRDVQHYSMIKPHQRYKPDLVSIDWEMDILK